MNSYLWSFAELVWNDVCADARHLRAALLNHTSTCLRTDAPACGLQLRLVHVGIVLAWRCLEELGLFGLQIPPYLCANLDGWLMLLNLANAWRVVAWTGLIRLLLFLRRVTRNESH